MSYKAIKGNSKAISCLLEKTLMIPFGHCFELIHDGGKTGSMLYTKLYMLKIDGKPVNTFLRFTYDLRAGYGELEISHENLIKIENELNKISTLEELIAALEKENNNKRNAGELA